MILDALFHPVHLRQETSEREARAMIALHLVAGALGTAAALVWLAARPPSSLLEAFCLASLASPLGLAFAARRIADLRLLHLLSAANMILVLTMLALVTGGLASLFAVWLVLIPAEAALARRPLVLVFSLLAGSAAILLLAALSVFAPLPASLVPAPIAAPLYALSLVGGLGYAAALSLNVRRTDEAHAAALGESEANYRFIAENAADLILRLSRDGRVLYASPSTFALTGRRPMDILDRPVTDLVARRDAVPMQRALARVAYYGEEQTIECVLATAAREGTVVELKCRPMRRPEPIRPPRFLSAFWRKPAAPPQSAGQDVIAIARDMTARNLVEQNLRLARSEALAQTEAKSRFLANMSHELRTPLNSILGFSQMIEGEMFGPAGHPRYKEYAGLIGESGRFLLELINDVLDLSKVEAGRYELRAEAIDTTALVRRTLRLMAPQFRDKGVALRFLQPAQATTVSADPRAVRQIVFNLLSNALKFTPAGGTVEIALGPDAGEWRLTVKDTGIGIAERDLKRLTERFVRADADYVRAEEGTGLGLSLVRALTEMQGGRLSIESELGAGTAITVALPLAGAPAAAIAA